MYIKVYPFAKLVGKTKLNLTPFFYVDILDGFENFAEAIKKFTGKDNIESDAAGYYIGYEYLKKKQKIAALLLFNKATLTPGIIAHEVTHACIGILSSQGFKIENINRDIIGGEIPDSSIEEVFAYMVDSSVDQVFKALNVKI